MQVVLDASLAIALILEEDVPASSLALFTMTPSTEFFVPAMWYWEVANGALNGVRRGGKDWQLVVEQIRDLPRFEIFQDPQSTARALGPTLSLALKRGLTSYDAAYLELALRRELPLATLDGPLADAARVEGVELIGG